MAVAAVATASPSSLVLIISTSQLCSVIKPSIMICSTVLSPDLHAAFVEIGRADPWERTEDDRSGDGGGKRRREEDASRAHRRRVRLWRRSRDPGRHQGLRGPWRILLLRHHGRHRAEYRRGSGLRSLGLFLLVRRVGVRPLGIDLEVWQGVHPVPEASVAEQLRSVLSDMAVDVV